MGFSEQSSEVGEQMLCFSNRKIRLQTVWFVDNSSPAGIAGNTGASKFICNTKKIVKDKIHHPQYTRTLHI